MRFDKSSLLNGLIIGLIVIGLVGLYDQVIDLGPTGVVTRIATLTAKNGLWVGLGIKLLDWLTKQRESLDRATKLTDTTAQENRKAIGEISRLLSELDARLVKQTQDLYIFKAETSVNSSLAELRQEVREIQHRVISLELDKPQGRE